MVDGRADRRPGSTTGCASKQSANHHAGNEGYGNAQQMSRLSKVSTVQCG